MPHGGALHAAPKQTPLGTKPRDNFKARRPQKRAGPRRLPRKRARARGFKGRGPGPKTLKPSSFKARRPSSLGLRQGKRGAAQSASQVRRRVSQSLKRQTRPRTGGSGGFAKRRDPRVTAGLKKLGSFGGFRGKFI